jgi:signal transduction histidine kinase
MSRGTADRVFANGAAAVPSLATTAADRDTQTRAWIAFAGFAVVFAGIVPFARIPLPAVPAFIPSYETAIVVNDLITAVLLYGQHAATRSRALLPLSAGYLFTALMALVHALSFPGMLSPAGLLSGGPQTTAWLYMFWHAGFPLFVLGYTRLHPDKAATPASRSVVAGGLIAVPILVTVLTLCATFGHDFLPAVMQDGGGYTAAQRYAVSAVWAIGFAAILALWRKRDRTVLDLWLTLATAAWLFDVALSGVLNASRFDLGFYAGRLYGLLAASFVLVVLVLEISALHRRLAQALAEAADRNRRLEESTAALMRSQEQLTSAQRMQAIGRLASGVAHHFNNVLTVVIGNLDLARSATGNNAFLATRLALAHRAARRGAGVTRQLLTFSRRQMVRPEIIEPSARLPDLATLLSGALQRQTVETAIPADLWRVAVDASELELAMLNLGLNARDAMPNGGTLKISAENRRVSDARLGLDGDYVVISVADSGTGIAPDILSRIFDPFFTTKDIAEGTGLGLSQVHGFANQAGGAVDVSSVVGQGSNFRLYLPAAGSATARQPANLAHRHPATSSTILIVEDEADVAELAAEILQRCGYKVRLVERANLALELIDRDDGIDLVFSDILMPEGMNGIALAEEVGRRFPRLPVLLATGYTEAFADATGKGLQIIGKPYGTKELCDQITRLIERR